MHETFAEQTPIKEYLFRGVQLEHSISDRDTGRATIGRARASITNAVWTKPVQVGTQAKSDTPTISWSVAGG